MIDAEWAALEHRLGVLPLFEAFFERGAPAEALAGGKPGSLGFFTPTPEPGWEAAAVAGETSGEEVLLTGLVRLASPATGGSLVLVRLDGGHRLAWVDHGAPGAERRGTRSGGEVRGDSPCWLALDGTAVASGHLSRPVTLEPGGELARLLAGYAGAWAATAVQTARDGVQALRRAARTVAFNTSQLVALGITEVEIETELTFAAVQRIEGLDALAVATAAARTLALVAAKTEELRDSFGLEIDGPLAAGAKTLTARLGGALLLEHELARSLGIGEEARG